MEILIGIVALIFVSIVMVAIGERLGLPWPTLLTVVIAGAIFVPGLPSLDVPSDMILPIFLPPLLWALARRTSWAVIRSQLSTVISLSVLLVVATIAAVTGTLMLMYPTLGVAAAVVIGAALAPPDPVAVDAVASRPRCRWKVFLTTPPPSSLFTSPSWLFSLAAICPSRRGYGTLWFPLLWPC